MIDQRSEKYLVSIQERDIDLLLMEELHVSGGFVSWLCDKVELPDVVFQGAWHSVSNDEGETDICLVVTTPGKRIAILIENKINASEQDQQDERYHVRGAELTKKGDVDEYLTVICAPQKYLDGLSSESKYEYKLSYEEIADWFNASNDSHAAWRKNVVLQAIDHGRRGYVMQVDDKTTSFHQEYFEYLQKKHQPLRMNKPKDKPLGSTWIYYKGEDFPKKVHLVHKMDRDVMQLCFAGRKVQELRNADINWPDDISLKQQGKEAALSIQVPPVDPRKDFSTQLDAIERVLDATYRLMEYRKLLVSDGM